MYKLKIISSTVRPGRKGPLIAEWIAKKVEAFGSFDYEIVDLGELNLPMMDEPNHPSLKKYEHEHTLKWSAKIEEADAFIFVTSEYNYGYPAALRNALEYLQQEWAYKAGAIVSYGGISAGTRAANSLKADLATLKIVPIMEMVNIPFFSHQIDQEEKFIGNEKNDAAAFALLRQLLRWTKGLVIIKADTDISE